MSDIPSSLDLAPGPGHILFVDDDLDVLKAAELALGRRGLRLTTARNPTEAWSVLAAGPVDVVLLDLNFSRGATSGEEGFRCLTDIIAQDPDAVVVVVTGHSGVNIAVAAMRAGASDFVMKPWRNENLAATLQAAVELRRRRREAAQARAGAGRPPGEAGEAGAPILGESPAIERVRGLIRRAAPTSAPVLIHGEAGTGKSLIARAIHLQSGRGESPLAAVDFGSLGEDAATLALFGGAGDPGALVEARGGTLFLDEAGEMPPPLQARLLAALEGPGAGHVRIVSATRRRREALRGRGGLREDLLARLNTVEIFAPPLRERGADVLILAEHFLRLFAQRYGRPVRALSPEAAEAIAEQAWPGDVRALRQAMERCVIFAEGGRYELADVPMGEPAEDGAVPMRRTLDLAGSERVLIVQALKKNAFNVSHTARQLGLTRAALYRRMAKHGL
jgi:DNA-binding NtrC family response regulator